MWKIPSLASEGGGAGSLKAVAQMLLEYGLSLTGKEGSRIVHLGPNENIQPAKMIRVALAPAAATAVPGDVMTWQNPEQCAIMLLNFQLDIQTPSTAASTLDAGIAATVASADNLVNGIDSGSAAIKSQTSNADTIFLEIPEDYYITVSEKTGDASAALAGFAYIWYACIAGT